MKLVGLCLSVNLPGNLIRISSLTLHVRCPNKSVSWVYARRRTQNVTLVGITICEAIRINSALDKYALTRSQSAAP